MTKLLSILLLTIALLLGSTGMSWATANKRNAKAENAIKCAAVYMIASAMTENNKKAAKHLAAIQQYFQWVYGAIERKRIRRPITNGMISRAKSSYQVRLGKQYDRNPNQVYTLEMQCNAWRALMASALSKIDSSSSQKFVERAFRNVPGMPSAPFRSDPRWSRSKVLIDASFKKWTEMGRITPQSVRDKLRRSSK
jgi:hypothetical protein